MVAHCRHQALLPRRVGEVAQHDAAERLRRRRRRATIQHKDQILRIVVRDIVRFAKGV